MLLAEGDRVPADGQLITSHELALDESMLTGESQPVRKPLATDGSAQPMVYAGSIVVQGQGWATVTATGPRSQLGQIGLAVTSIEPPPSPLQRETRQLVRRH
jgi:Ca2+-transporting ATPase